MHIPKLPLSASVAKVAKAESCNQNLDNKVVYNRLSTYHMSEWNRLPHRPESLLCLFEGKKGLFIKRQVGSFLVILTIRKKVSRGVSAVNRCTESAYPLLGACACAYSPSVHL